jgi:hypothetical protein
LESFHLSKFKGENLIQENNEKFNLFWLCARTGKKHRAGVAFFNEVHGDYQLKVDALRANKRVFLKITSMSDGVIRYRVDSVDRRGRSNSQRSEIGRGFSDANGNYPIRMELSSFSNALLMEPSA